MPKQEITMSLQQVNVLLNAVRQNPTPGIGFDKYDQKLFDRGWYAAKEEVYTAILAIGIDPSDFIPDSPDE